MCTPIPAIHKTTSVKLTFLNTETDITVNQRVRNLLLLTSLMDNLPVIRLTTLGKDGFLQILSSSLIISLDLYNLPYRQHRKNNPTLTKNKAFRTVIKLSQKHVLKS